MGRRRQSNRPSRAAVAASAGMRVRHDGWTQARIDTFLGTLAETGCVRDACRVAGLSTHSAYRHRRAHPAFAEAWDKALARAQRGLTAIAYQRATEGADQVIIRKGEVVETRRKPSDAILGLLVKNGMQAGAATADEVLTFAEWQDLWRFDDDGNKHQIEDPEIAAERVRQKIYALRDRMEAYAVQGGQCPYCRQPWKRDGRSIAELVAMGLVDPAPLFT